MDYINTYSKLRLLYNFKRSINVIIYLVQANISNFFCENRFYKTKFSEKSSIVLYFSNL